MGGCSVQLMSREGGSVHLAPPLAAGAPQAMQDQPAHTSQTAAMCPEAGAFGCSGLGGIWEPQPYTWADKLRWVHLPVPHITPDPASANFSMAWGFLPLSPCGCLLGHKSLGLVLGRQ